MEVGFFGVGPVAQRCRKVLDDLGIHVSVNPECADLWLSIHWPEKFKTYPKGGILNLHNSYLPWNGGAHPCTWAILDRTPHGVTMHWCTDKIDKGPIFMQRKLEIYEDDTADSLYKRTADEEVKLFRDAMDAYRLGLRRASPQEPGGSYHTKADFYRLIRAVTTSDCKVVCA